LPADAIDSPAGNEGFLLLHDYIHCQTNKHRRSQIKTFVHHRTQAGQPNPTTILSAVAQQPL
jgi:hypothetical protein